MKRKLSWLAIPAVALTLVLGGCGVWENLKDPEGPISEDARE